MTDRLPDGDNGQSYKGQALGTDNNGFVRKIKVDEEGNLIVELEGDTGGFVSTNTVFGDKITASRVAQITGNFYFGVQEGEYDSVTNGSGSISLKGGLGYENLLSVASGATANSDARIEDLDSMRYIPGFELGAFVTTVFTEPTGDGYIKIGLTDSGANGFFVGFKEVDGKQKFGFGRVKDGVETFITQDEFNGDKLDGTGLSKVTLDPSKGNIWLVRFGYLGFAPPTLQYVTPEGKLILVHKIEYPNSSDETHISSTYLSPYAEVSNGTTAENVEVKIGSVCAYVVDGNAVGINDRDFSYGTTGTLASGAYARRLLIEFRNSGSFQGALMPSAKTHKINAILNYLSITLDGQNKPVVLEILVIPDADITGGTYSKVSNNSILDLATDSTVNTFANAQVIFTDTFKSNIADKIEPFLDKLKLKLRTGYHAVFTLTSDTTLAIDWAFANAWSEEF